MLGTDIGTGREVTLHSPSAYCSHLQEGGRYRPGGPSGSAILRIGFETTRAMIIKGDLCVDGKAIVF